MGYQAHEHYEKLLFVLAGMLGDEGDAKLITEQVLNHFGYGVRYPDNHLRADDRDNFNTLEELGILEVESERESLPLSGKWWTLHYWKFTDNFLEGRLEKDILDSQRAAKLAEEAAKEKEETVEGLYESIPDNVWERNGEESTPDKSRVYPASLS